MSISFIHKNDFKYRMHLVLLNNHKHDIHGIRFNDIESVINEHEEICVTISSSFKAQSEV